MKKRADHSSELFDVSDKIHSVFVDMVLLQMLLELKISAKLIVSLMKYKKSRGCFWMCCVSLKSVALTGISSRCVLD